MLCPSCKMKSTNNNNSLQNSLRAIKATSQKIIDAYASSNDDIIQEVDAKNNIVATITKSNGSSSAQPGLGTYRAVPTADIF